MIFNDNTSLIPPVNISFDIGRLRVSISRMKKLFRVADGICGKLEKLGFPAVQLGIRLYMACVFFKSGLLKISDWEKTVALFRDEYKVPLLPPELAALLGTAGELILPVLLAFGIAGRFAALGLMFMSLVIYLTYDQSWPPAWALMLAVIVVTGAGKLSLDYVIKRKLKGLS